VVTQRSLVQVHREIFDDPLLDQCLDPTLAGTCRQVYFVGEPRPADTSVALEPGQDACVILIHNERILRSKD